eukprot:366049-Chlamydomonas_euryale.AAC.5
MLIADTRVCQAIDPARVRDTGSGPTEGMPVPSAARQRGSSSGRGAVTKSTPLSQFRSMELK